MSDIMFKATIKTKTIRDVLSAIAPLTSEIRLVITPRGTHTMAVDPAHVCMIDVNIPITAYCTYDATDDTIGIPLNKVLDFLKLVKTEEISMEYGESNGRLTLTTDTLTRKIATLDISGDDPKTPALDLRASATINVDNLSKIVKATSSVSDHVRIEITPNGLRMTAMNDADEVEMTIGKADLVGLQTDANYSSMFPLDYFTSIVKATPSNTEMTMSIADDYPATFGYHISDCTIKYLLAPRIEGDD